MLKTIIIVTISVLNLGNVERAWEEYLDYETVSRGQVSEELSEVWNTEAMAGRNYLIMQPESGAEVYVRFIENPANEGYVPLNSQGWNATELLVKDPDALAAEMDGSPFEVVGPPADLWPAPDAPRAMQVVGPGNEMLYLTRNNDFATETPVDRVFIMVVGSSSLDTLSDYYEQQMGLSLGDPLALSVPFMAETQGLASDTLYPLRVAILSSEFLLELDEYPASVGPRQVTPGYLPPGAAMVGFTATDLNALDVDWRAPPAAIDAFPYNGRQVGVAVGPAGEWLEIIETAQAD